MPSGAVLLSRLLLDYEVNSSSPNFVSQQLFLKNFKIIFPLVYICWQGSCYAHARAQ